MAYMGSNGSFIAAPANIQNVFTGWTNVDWATFTSSGVNITSAINPSSPVVTAYTDYTPLSIGQTFCWKFYITYITGSSPTNSPYMALKRSGGSTAFDLSSMSPGFNGYEYMYTVQYNDTYRIIFGNNAKNVNVSCNFEFYVKNPLRYFVL